MENKINKIERDKISTLHQIYDYIYIWILRDTIDKVLGILKMYLNLNTIWIHKNKQFSYTPEKEQI